MESSTLNSLACELTFNDLRDAERRSQKHEMRNATSVAAAAVKSGWSRSPLSNITLEAKDWSERESAKLMKTTVLSNFRQGDKELGIPMHEITSQKTCPHLTKPHVLTERIRLYSALRAEFRADATVNLEQLVSDSWPCRMLLPGSLWRERADGEVRVILKSGPNLVRFSVVYHVTYMNEPHYKLCPVKSAVKETLRFSPLEGEVSLLVGIASADHGLLFKAEAWLSPIRYLLSHTVTSMNIGWVAQFCRLLGMNLNQSTHADRVRQFMEREGYPEDFIMETLEQLPTQRPRAARPDANEDVFLFRVRGLGFSLVFKF